MKTEEREPNVIAGLDASLLTIRLFAWLLWRIGHRLQGQVFVDG